MDIEIPPVHVSDWMPLRRLFVGYVVARYSWGLSGSPNLQVELFRRKGKAVRFWTHAGAQDFADTLNENSPA